MEIIDLIAEVFTAKQWSRLLKAPLERAAFRRNRSLVQKLTRAGAEVGYVLHSAVRGGHGEIVNDLLESGASVNVKNVEGNSPLHLAAQMGKAEIVELLLLHGADKDALGNDRRTPLFLAVSDGHVGTALALFWLPARTSMFDAA